MKRTKTPLLKSALALLLCLSMLVGSTFAWFTDSVTSKGNIIQSGNLDIEMYWTDDLNSGNWYNVEEDAHNTIFSYDNWEPGYTDVKYIKLVNKGNLAMNYKLTLTPQGSVGKLAEVINVFFADQAVDVQSREDLSKLGAIGLLNNVLNGGATANGTLLAKDQYSPLHPSGEVIMTIAMNMITTAGNDYQEKDSGEFTITALATQASFEKDSFGSDYDSNAEYPTIITGGTVTTQVNAVDGKVPAGGVTMTGNGISAFVPGGIQMADGADVLTLSVTPMEHTTTDITVVNNEILIPVDVHISGIAVGNTTPIVIDLGEVLPKYMNMGNYHLYHVENGGNSVMTLVDNEADLTQHNRFTYDPLTGAVKVAMASFSEVALVADTTKAWEGNYDYSWYINAVAPVDGESAPDYTIANADQLAAFGAIVGGMAEGIEKDSFAGKTVKLLADINLADGEKSNNNVSKIFYPVGYNYTNDKNADGTTGDYYSTVKSFEGTFDGNGHTISNFYQNTWEIKGDYDGNYYSDAMGLFGYVVNGTVKNLTVDSFTSDGEFTPTGVIAAYAVNSTFENIAITNCEPRVYNTGNGGIVGIGGNSDDPDNYNLTFNNITIDNTNTITALWGSWDVACGGLVGMFRGDGHVQMTNCHVAAQINVYNDVCGNYQYYWYRYSGMLVGTNKNMTTDTNGYTVPETDKFHAENCTVHFGEWNDYYYCELVANSLASYTHDHQFSRLEQIQNVSEIQDENGKWKRTGNFILMNGKEPTETCYHIIKKNNDLVQHTHESEGTEIVNGETVPKENNQRIYLPFNQLFTGYGWGVKHVPIYDDGTPNPFEGVTILDRVTADSVTKFETKFKGDFLYRVGNKNSVSIGTLFAAAPKLDAQGNELKDENDNPIYWDINDTGVWVTVEKFNKDMNVSGKFTAATTDWTMGTIKFEGTGIAKITIQDYNFCTPTVLYVEVVDAYNATTAGGDYAVKNRNTVLLENVKMGTNGNLWLENTTLYGNGFEYDVTAARDGNTESGYIGGNYAVALKNAQLDNVKIIGEVYTKYGATAKSEYNYPTILTNGNSVIANSYVSNGSSAIRAQDGNLEIINSTLEGGIFANLDIRGGTVTLDNVITINQSTADGSSTSNDKGIVGLGIVFYECNLAAKLYVKTDANGNPLLKQYNCIAKNTKFNDTTAEQLKTAMFKSTHEELQYRDSNGVVWINPCILSITEGIGKDNISDIKGYTGKPASVASYSGYVYTAVPTGIEPPPTYTSFGQYNILPNVYFDHEAERNYVAPSTGSNEYCYYNSDTKQLEISFDQGKNKEYDPNILNVSKTGTTLKYTVKIDGVDYTGKTITFDKAGTYTAVYTYTDPNNFKLNSKGEVVSFPVDYEKTVTISVSVVAATAKDAKFTFYGYNSISKTPATTITDVKTVTSNSGNIYIMPSATGENVNSYTIDGITVNCPRVYVDFKDNSSDFNWLYPVFLGVKIEDYANGGTADAATTIVSPTSTSKPANLTILTVDKPSGGGGWSSGSGKSGSEGILAEGVNKEYKGLYGWTSGALGSDQPANSIYCQFTYKDNKGTTYYYVIEFYREKHTCPSCVTPDTLITLADGTQERVDSLKGDEMLLVWNLETGKYEAAPIVFVDTEKETEYEIIHLYFSDGSDVKIIDEHGFFDLDLGKYVYIDANNYADYVGHRFVAEGDIAANDWNVVTLDEVVIETEVTTAWSPVTFEHLCYYTNGVLSMPGGIEGLFNIFEVDTDTMRYDAEQMQKDIETYGLFTYEDFGGMIPEIAFEAFNGAYLKVSIGKGLLTWEDIAYLAERYIPLI